MAIKAAKKKLYQAMTRGFLRPFARRAYDLVIWLELAWERGLDRLSAGRRTPIPPVFNEQVTAIIKTFERPAALKRLVDSIRRLYPDMPIIVVDDSRLPREISGVTLVKLPFDSGVSAGRQAGLEKATTPFVFILDDDRVFFRGTDLPAALGLMATYPEIDILGVEVVNLPFYALDDYRSASIYPTTKQPTLPPGSTIGGMPVYDKVANSFLARTERLRLVGWDPQIKRLDHAEFFTRARGVLTSVVDRNLKLLHAPTPFDAGYMGHRLDFLLDQTLIRMRYFRSPTDAP